MPEKQTVRPFKGWAVVNRNGHILVDTARSTRKAAIKAYGYGVPSVFTVDSESIGVRVEKIIIQQRGSDD
jgi:hypothetical protein